MSQIEIRCVDQTAMFTNLPEIFSGDVNIDTVKFTFDDSWNGYTTKTAVFYNNPKDVYPQILDSNNIAVIPSQVMTKQCKLSIGVFGTKANGDVKTSKILTYNVGKGAISSELQSTVTPDFWTQLLSRQINYENNLTQRQTTFESNLTQQQSNFENNITQRQNTFESNMEGEFNTFKTNVTNEVDTLEGIVKGRNQALAYNSYSEMITTLNSMTKDELKRGQNIYIGTVGVPDLWVYSVETTKSTYSYTNDKTFVNSLNNNVTVKVGYYKLAQLETQKVDLTNIESDIDTLQSDVNTLEGTVGTNKTSTDELITALTNRVAELENQASAGWTLLCKSINPNNEPIPLPSEYKELLILCQYYNNETYVTEYIIREMLDSNDKYFYHSLESGSTKYIKMNENEINYAGYGCNATVYYR